MKIFITLVCSIFVVILTFLLVFAWREAFFTKKIDQWKIDDYISSSQRQIMPGDTFAQVNSESREEDPSRSSINDSDYDSRPRSNSDISSNYQIRETRNEEIARVSNNVRAQEPSQNQLEERNRQQNSQRGQVREFYDVNRRENMRRSDNLEERRREMNARDAGTLVEERPSAFRLDEQERRLRMRRNVLEVLENEQRVSLENHHRIREEIELREGVNNHQTKTREKGNTGRGTNSNEIERKEKKENKQEKVEREAINGNTSIRIHPDYAIAIRSSPEKVNKAPRRKLVKAKGKDKNGECSSVSDSDE